MILLDSSRTSVDIRLTQDELGMLGNALNEVCNGIHFEDSEFQTRIGSHRAAVCTLLENITSAFRRSNTW